MYPPYAILFLDTLDTSFIFRSMFNFLRSKEEREAQKKVIIRINQEARFDRRANVEAHVVKWCNEVMVDGSKGRLDEKQYTQATKRIDFIRTRLKELEKYIDKNSDL